jgi:glutaredoxin
MPSVLTQGRIIALLKKTPALFKTLPGAVRKDESPEDARLATCGAREITLYTRTGCHLCEEAKALIEPILGECGVALLEVDIEQDAALQQRYGTDIPVIFIGGRKAAKHRVDPVKFRRQLSAALRMDC